MFNQILNKKWLLVLVTLLITISACSNQPQEIHYANDECAHCQMVIMDEKFAAQIVTKRGKAFKFDSIECLAAYIKNQDVEAAEQTLWVHDFTTVEWLNAKDATFVKSDVIKSPMGMGLLAFNSKAAANDNINQYPGTIVSWNELVSYDMKSHSKTMEMKKH